MRRLGYSTLVLTLPLAMLQVGGCPSSLEYVAGTTGDNPNLGTTASVSVLSPTKSMSISGGTPIQVNWRTVSTTTFSNVKVIFDPDKTPNNGNEIEASTGLAASDNSALLDTSRLAAGTYNIGVVLSERNALAAFGYASGTVTVNQAAQLVFNSPFDNFVFDRTSAIVPRFDVDWTVADPDSNVTVNIYLDPDDSPNGNEVLLRSSTQQTGDRFTFNLPTAGFKAGRYRILAIVDDGTSQLSFYAPGSIRLRDRLAGVVDLRDLNLTNPPIAGAIFEGVNPRDNAGSFVGSARDLDRDGFGDFIILSQFAKPSFQFDNLDRTGVGEAYLIYGRSTRFRGSINLNSAATLFRTNTFTGPQQQALPTRPSRGITSFDVLSDWDGDNFREIALGMPFTDSASSYGFDAPGYFRSGAVVVVSSSALRPDLAFPGDTKVIGLDDVGSLPHQDLVQLSQPLFECPEGFTGPKVLSNGGGGGDTYFNRHLNVPANPFAGERLGCRFSSNELDDNFGESISAYQFNGLIMAAPNRDPLIASPRENALGRSTPGAGVISVFYCDVPIGFHPWNETAAPAANAATNYAGVQVPFMAELLPHGGPYWYIVGDVRTSTNRIAFTPGYVVNEGDQGFDANGGCPSLRPRGHGSLSRQLGFSLYGTDAGGRLSNVAAIEDFNGDGLDDIVIGNPFANNGAGETFIVFGRIPNLVAGGDVSLSELRLPQNGPSGTNVRIFDGIRIAGSQGERLGQSQASAGDFNHDGLPDVVIGSPLLNNRRGGAAIVFGTREAVNQNDADVPFSELASRGLGVVLVGDAEGDLAGARVVGIGDVDGDGVDDLLIAAPEKTVRLDTDLDGSLEIDRSKCGVVYLVYGSPNLKGTVNLSDIGTEKLPGVVFVGRNSNDQLGATIGEQGDRSFGVSRAGDVDGDGFADLLISSVKGSPRGRESAGEVYLIYGRGDR